MKCIIGRGQLLGHSIEHEAEVAVVIADMWLPSCIDHAESFAESQDRAIAGAPNGAEASYRSSFRLARLDEMPVTAPRFERAGPIAPPSVVPEPEAPPIVPRASERARAVSANRTPRPANRTQDDELRRIMEEGF